MGDPDLTIFISAETNKIPFKESKPEFNHWPNVFRSWPSKFDEWEDWFKRISAAKRSSWKRMGIEQCLQLFLANMPKNESLLSATTYFWSNTINAIIFGHGPMTPTLLDIKMLTGLDITSLANPISLKTKSEYKIKTKAGGGWSGYIKRCGAIGPITDEEHISSTADKQVYQTQNQSREVIDFSVSSTYGWRDSFSVAQLVALQPIFFIWLKLFVRRSQSL